MSGTYLSAGAIQGPIPASLQDAIAQVNAAGFLLLLLFCFFVFGEILI